MVDPRIQYDDTAKFRVNAFFDAYDNGYLEVAAEEAYLLITYLEDNGY